jgi:hypothetical protein
MLGAINDERVVPLGFETSDLLFSVTDQDLRVRQNLGRWRSDNRVANPGGGW